MLDYTILYHNKDTRVHYTTLRYLTPHHSYNYNSITPHYTTATTAATTATTTTTNYNYNYNYKLQPQLQVDRQTHR